MDIAEYKALVAEEGCRLEAGSEVGRLMDEAAYAAQRVTARINNGSHTQEELCELFSELTGRAVDMSFKLFPPFLNNSDGTARNSPASTGIDSIRRKPDFLSVTDGIASWSQGSSSPISQARDQETPYLP